MFKLNPYRSAVKTFFQNLTLFNFFIGDFPAQHQPSDKLGNLGKVAEQGANPTV